MRRAVIGLISVWLMSCSTLPVPQHELIDQIIRPRLGFEGKLTNRACLEYAGDKCKKDNIISYDLADPSVREKLNRLDFICNIGGKRWKICMDSTGFCRKNGKTECQSWDIFKMFCTYTFKWEYLPMEPYQFLIDAKTRCFSKQKYSFDLGY